MVRHLFRAICAAFFFSGGANLMKAQDVTVSPLAWADPDDAPEVLPKFAHEIRPSFPTDLKQMKEVGWASIDFMVDERGKLLTWAVHGSQPLFERAVAEEAGNRGKIQPAKRSGQPVISHVRMSVLFNPASADVHSDTTTPRLLEAVPVIDATRVSAKNQPALPPEVVWATVSLDEQGNPIGVKNAPAELRGSFEKSVRLWRFMPARRNGVAIAAELAVPFIILPPPSNEGKKMIPPRWVKRTPPEYPIAMRRSGLRGDVVLEFLVDIEGRVRNAVVVSTLNPAFNKPALDAIRHWKFEPGRVDDVPVVTRLQQSITFSLEVGGGGEDGFEVTRRGDVSKMPETLRYDVPPKIKYFVLPKYPYDLLVKGTHGRAEVRVLVAPDGTVAASKVGKADQAEFGYAVQAAVDRMTYEPALKNAQPTSSLTGFEQRFDAYEDVLVSQEDRDLLQLERKHPEQILKSSELDKPAKPAYVRQPVYPRGLGADHGSGEAVVEFLVDKEGVVRLPRIISSTRPEFGYAAIQAVSEWHFLPPTSHGKPGVFRARVPIAFNEPVAVPEAQPKS